MYGAVKDLLVQKNTCQFNMALCCVRWTFKLRIKRRIIALCLVPLLVIYFMNISVLFHVQTRDDHAVHAKNKVVIQHTSPNPDANNDSTLSHLKWVRKPYSPNAVLKIGVLGNYEPKLDRNRTGPGEYGVRVRQNQAENNEREKSSRIYGFDMVNSDKISLDRIINDIRDEECKYWHYPEILPTASVVIVFYNEGWSTFVRTVHSVINMSPSHLLHEVLLVDDASDKEHLTTRLEEHMNRFGNKVKIIRNKNREGLIRARSIGARAAAGDVVVFLDAHCECGRNWLPPLLSRIAYDRTIMAAPLIDIIHWSSYTVRPASTKMNRGIFEWGFYYKEMPVPQQEIDKRQHKTEPYWSPTNAGGLFAIDRLYFLELGAYDPQLEIWGGENFELAFKNYVRVVEVWMDGEFKEYFYRREPQTRGYPTNITKQLQFKKDNNCRSFKWFMDNVAYDIYNRFPPPAPNKAWGKIRSRHFNGTKCLAFVSSYKSKSALGLYSCLSASSVFRLNIYGQLGVGEKCVQAVDDQAITLEWCVTTDLTGPWQWDKVSGQLYNKIHEKCVAAEINGKITFRKCDKEASNQKWDITEWYTW